jgi:hypothetical protein
MKNWKTTLVGLIAGGSYSIDAILKDGLANGWKHALIGLAIALLGAFAQDSSNTPTAQK